MLWWVRCNTKGVRYSNVWRLLFRKNNIAGSQRIGTLPQWGPAAPCSVGVGGIPKGVRYSEIWRLRTTTLHVEYAEYAERENEYAFYSYVACFVNTFSLNMYVSMSYTGLTRRNTLFILLWLRHRNTWIAIQHVGLLLLLTSSTVRVQRIPQWGPASPCSVGVGARPKDET